MELSAHSNDGSEDSEGARTRDKAKPPQIQRTVAFDLSSPSEDKQEEKTRRVTISDVTINKIDCDSDENQMKDSSSKLSHKDSVNIKREIIGILKPPNLKKELKSFPSLPECFLHDLGLLDSLVLSAENLSEQDIETKFSSLSLAFKTDRMTLQERLELQHRQRDIAERNAEDEIRQLKTSVQCLNRMCQQSDTRELLRSLEKQVTVLAQSLQRVSSSSEQFGAVQQEGKVATAIEIVLLHVDNLKRNYEKEHNELEDARRILIEHKLLVDDSHYVRPSNRNRSISVVQTSNYVELSKPRRASTSLSTSLAQKHLDVSTVEVVPRPRSPAAIRKVSQNSPLTTVKEDSDIRAGCQESDSSQSVQGQGFSSIEETGEELSQVADAAKNDDNNNNDNMNKNEGNGAADLHARRKESRKTSQFDVNTIMEEIDHLAAKRDSSPNKQSKSKPLPKTPTEFMQRKKSLLVQLQGWYDELAWPYDEDDTILCIRYSISAILTTAALAILLSTLLA